MKKILLCSAFLFCCLPLLRGISAAEPSAFNAPRKHILLVGVSEYQAKEGERAAGILGDAVLLKERFQKLGADESDITMLTEETISFDPLDEGIPEDSFPTLRNICQAADRILAESQEGDFVFIAFFGYGFRLNGQLRFAPYDFDPKDTGTAENSSFSISDLLARLKKSPASFRMAALDLNRNKILTVDSEEEGSGLKNLGGTFVIESGELGGKSFGPRNRGFSFFAYNLAEGFSFKADRNWNGKVTLSELAEWTVSHTLQNTRQEQKPLFWGDGKSAKDVILIADPKAREIADLIPAYREFAEKKEYRNAYRQIQKIRKISPENELFEEAEVQLRSALVMNLLDSAQKAMNSKDYRKVIDITGEILEIDPRQAEARGMAGIAKLELIPEFAAVPPLKEGDPSPIVPVHPDEKLEEIAGRASVVVLDLNAVWCGPCRALTPYLERTALSLKGKDVLFFTVDVDENKETASSLGVGPIPDVRIFVNGRPHSQLMGFDPYGIYTAVRNAAEGTKSRR